MSPPKKPKTSGFLSWYFRVNLLKRILTGLVLGAVCGCVLGAFPQAAALFVDNARIFGDLFIRLLKMIVVPVILFSLVTGAASISPSQLGRVGLKTLLYYFATSVISVAIALALANLLRPGQNMGIAGDAAVKGTEAHAPPLSQILLEIVPTNPAESLARGDVLPIIFFALVFGIALAVVRDSKDGKVAAAADRLFELCSICAETMYKVVGGIMQYAPVGVFVLIAVVFAQQGPKAVGSLLFVTLTVYVSLAVHLVVGYGGMLRVISKLSFVKFVKGAYAASLTAFVTRSSNGTLPVTMRVCEDKMGVPRSVSSFTLPVGATINMDGTAIYLAVCAMFIGFATGQPLTLNQQLTVMITATLASVGTAGVPGAGAIMLLMVLESIDLPVTAGSSVAAAYAMILGIDSLLDMGRTCMNVTGDMAGAVIVSKSERVLDEGKWSSAVIPGP
ncbi:MAG: dicarboxylate/amino acid:cation symporter [Deltaproteobacteria bacterium]|jgi:Na+/H+-dicarboxylate symporter|nr:dicarboxylate/amino acid:cation symporter [Deltaproteobacteria bacterium]